MGHSQTDATSCHENISELGTDHDMAVPRPAAALSLDRGKTVRLYRADYVRVSGLTTNWGHA